MTDIYDLTRPIRDAALAEIERAKGLNLMLRLGEQPKESIAPTARLNRSDKWQRANTYAYAREIGPSSEPVR